jgi:tripartite-type tricarboxylate transporter receptor subunit TctC
MPRPVRSAIAAWLLTAVAACTLFVPATARSADCPELRGATVRWIVPSRPGGGYDTYSRLLQPFLEQTLGVRLVIDNRPEAGGIVGAVAIRDATPDGRTLGLINASGLIAANAVDVGTAPDPVGDFRILGSIVSNHMVMFTGRDSGIGSLDQLLEVAQERAIVTGVRDAGSASFYAVPVTADLLGIDYALVTGYVGSAARAMAAVRGEVDVIFGHLDSLRGQVEAGELVPLLQLTPVERRLTAAERLAGADGVARSRAAFTDRTPGEAIEAAARLADIVGAGRLVVGPPDLPEPRTACIDAGLAEVLADDALATAAQRAGLGIEPGNGAAARARLQRAEQAVPRFEALIRAAVAQARG